MKTLFFLLLLLALPWKVVGAQITDTLAIIETDSTREVARIDRLHRQALWAFLDSLYRASQEVDSIRAYKIANFIMPYDTAKWISTATVDTIPGDSINALIREIQRLKEFLRLHHDSLYRAREE